MRSFFGVRQPQNKLMRLRTSKKKGTTSQGNVPPPVSSSVQTARQGMGPGSEGHGLLMVFPPAALVAMGRRSVVVQGVVAHGAPAHP